MSGLWQQVYGSVPDVWVSTKPERVRDAAHQQVAPHMQVKVVCLPVSRGNPGGFDDNKYGPCSVCGVAVQWRPHVPEPSDKVCGQCFLSATDVAEIRITQETLDELKKSQVTDEEKS